MTDSTSHSHQSKQSELSAQVFHIRNNISHYGNYIIFISLSLELQDNTKTMNVLMYLYGYKC